MTDAQLWEIKKAVRHSELGPIAVACIFLGCMASCDNNTRIARINTQNDRLSTAVERQA